MALFTPFRGPLSGGHVPGRLACQLRTESYRSLEMAPTARIGSRRPETRLTALGLGVGGRPEGGLRLTGYRLNPFSRTSGRMWGCGGKQPVKGDAPLSFDPCAPAGFDKPPSKEL